MKRSAELICVVLLCQLLVVSVTVQGFGQESGSSRKRVVTPRPAAPQPPQSATTRSDDEPQEYNEGDTLKIGVELVQVVFTVVDERNRLVTDLDQSEVEVLDAGQRQQIELFQRSNALPMVLSVLIDMSASQEFLLPDEKTAVATFLDSFFREGKDYGSIMTFKGDTNLSIGLTSNLKRLKTALQRIKREQDFRDEEGNSSDLGTALFDSIDIAAREVLDGPTARRITTPTDNTGNQRTVIRRAMIVLTDGVDTASQLSLNQALRSAQRYGISVYALGMGDSFRFSNVNTQALDRICKETGGRAFYPKSESELNQAFEQISKELSSQYILAYYPQSGNDAQTFRQIEIRVPRKSGWNVIHRSGYQQDDLPKQ